MKHSLVMLVVALGMPVSAAADDVRDFNADTPGKGYSPFTVPDQYTQIETDFLHYTDSGATQSFAYLDPDIKYGISHNAEIDLSFDGVIDTWTRSNGRTIRQSGFGDITPRIRWNYIGNDSGWFVGAVLFGVKIPVAPPGIGNGAVEYNLILPTQIDLPHDWTLNVQEEVDVLKNGNDTGKHFSMAETVALSKAITGKITLSGELAAQSGTDGYFPPVYTFDVGASYALSPSAIVAVGAYIGLNDNAPAVEAYSSIAFRF